jgi:hypothetical protein
MNVLGEFHKYYRNKNIVNQYNRIKKHKSKKKRKQLYSEVRKSLFNYQKKLDKEL